MGVEQKLEPVKVTVQRVPTPTPTVDDYTPVESEASQATITEEESKPEVVSRGMSPIEFAPPEESTMTEDPTEYSARYSRPTSREQTPRPFLDTPERTPPKSPESSVVESSVSVAKEAPPSPEKVVPTKMEEPTRISAVFDDMIDAGVQYEAPPSYRDMQTSPIEFMRPKKVEYSPPLDSTESSSEAEMTATSGSTTADGMSDHEWMLPHNMLKSEGEITPPKMPKGFISYDDVDTENDLLSRVSLSQGELHPRLTRPRSKGEIKGPVTEALFEMKNLMAASNQGAQIIPRVERRRFKPFTPRSDEENSESVSLKSQNAIDTNYQTPSTIPPKSPRKPTSNGSRGPIVHSTPKPPIMVQERPQEAQLDETNRSSIDAGQKSQEEELNRKSQDDQIVSQRSQESARTSSAFRLPLEGLNTEETISDIEEIMYEEQ